MQSRKTGIVVCVVAFSILCMVVFAASVAPHARSISLDTKGQKYIPVLSDPGDSYLLKSGSILLKPRESVGKHSTEDHEELVIVLEGTGEMVLADGSRIPMHANSAAYCPPKTEHDVRNTGQAPLRYVYVVARVP